MSCCSTYAEFPLRKPSYNRTYAVIIVMTIVKHAFAIAKLRERDNNNKKKRDVMRV